MTNIKLNINLYINIKYKFNKFGNTVDYKNRPKNRKYQCYLGTNIK